jgi:hypothetical protein
VYGKSDAEQEVECLMIQHSVNQQLALIAFAERLGCDLLLNGGRLVLCIRDRNVDLDGVGLPLGEDVDLVTPWRKDSTEFQPLASHATSRTAWPDPDNKSFSETSYRWWNHCINNRLASCLDQAPPCATRGSTGREISSLLLTIPSFITNRTTRLCNLLPEVRSLYTW